MSKQIYTEEQFQKAIKLKLEGIPVPEIVIQTGIKKPSLMKLFRERNIKLSEEQKQKLVIGARWKNHKSVVDNKKKCSKCQLMLDVSNFTKSSTSKSGYVNYCRACTNEIYMAKAEYISERNKKFRDQNREKIREKDSKYYEKNKEKIIAKTTAWRSENQDLAKSYEKKWRDSNRHMRLAAQAAYRSAKDSATPKWLTSSHKKNIQEFYKNCPKGMEVDHIVPIRSNVACGLHVPWNLQYLPAKINHAKASNFIDTSTIGVCHQFKVKQNTKEEDVAKGMPFGCKISELSFSKEDLSQEHKDFIKRYEWLGTTGYLTKEEVYVARHTLGHIAGIVIIAIPNSYTSEIPTEEQALIHRGATTSWAPKNLGSKLVMYAIKQSVKNTQRRVFFAYSDAEAGEIGTIYQACNFTYLGHIFGSKVNYKLPNGKVVSSRYFRKTSTLKRYAKEIGITWEPSWTKENKYKDLSKIPKEVMKMFKEYGRKEMLSGVETIIPPKGKYVMVLGRDRRETKKLRQEYAHKLVAFPYIKRG
jgi:hypothetical protein